MKTFADIFTEFDGPAKFSRAIGVPEFHGQTMKTRDSIPPVHWPAVVAAARERGIEWISMEQLALMAVHRAQEREAMAS